MQILLFPEQEQKKKERKWIEYEKRRQTEPSTTIKVSWIWEKVISFITRKKKKLYSRNITFIQNRKSVLFEAAVSFSKQRKNHTKR